MNYDQNLIPFPYVYKNIQQPGLLIEWPDKCNKCQDRQCEHPDNTLLSICSYGFNYQKVDGDIIISGIIASEFKISTPARTKNYKKYKDWIVQTSHINSVIENLRNVSQNHKNEIERRKAKVVNKYIESEQYKDDFLDKLKPEIQKGLSFVHDYKQINAQISQNINVIIETRYEGEDFSKKLERADHAETAIYWASKFLEGKLNVAKFLIHPDWITKQSESYPFRFHGLLIKYLRIYQYMFDNKNVRVSVSGQSYLNVDGNAEAIGVIPHTFLDNALKYSKQGGKVDIYVRDENHEIMFSVSSYGPKILSDELEKIFTPFYRGKNAELAQEEGAGYGLYVAQNIAHKLGTKIMVEQEDNLHSNLGYWTTFYIRIPCD